MIYYSGKVVFGMPIGERIRLSRATLKLTLEEVAQKVGVTRATVQKYESGAISNIPPDKLKALADALDVTPGYLMGWEDAPSLLELYAADGGAENAAAQLRKGRLSSPPPLDNVIPMPRIVGKPRLGTIACGVPILAQQNIEGYDQVPDYIKCDFTLLCKGDSMINARIHDGDIVCIRQTPEVENGQIAAVLIDGYFDAEATLKRVRFSYNGITLWPENPAYEPMVFSGAAAEKVRIIGVATHFISKIV